MFFSGYIGLLDSEKTEINTEGYFRVPVQFSPLGGGHETRSEVPVLFPAPSAPWSDCYALGLFQNASGDDTAVIYWPVEYFRAAGTSSAYSVPENDTSLLIHDTSSLVVPEQTIGITRSGCPIVSNFIISIDDNGIESVVSAGSGSAVLPSDVLTSSSDLTGNPVEVSGVRTTIGAALASAASTGSGGSAGSTTVPVTMTATPGALYALVFPASGSSTFDVTPNTALTLSISGGTPGQEQRVTLIIRQAATGYAVTLPAAQVVSSSGVVTAGVIYVGGMPAVGTTSGQATIITFYTDDGGTTIFAKSGF